jgi:hypothetical protein
MFGHGQIEGYREKYGMEYKQAYWEEEPDGHLVWLHEQRIFPLLRCRALFSGSENFVLYDFYTGNGVNEDVFAYSNRVGDQRGLVLYHNRYATTSGWVRESVAFAANADSDHTELRRTTLTAALDLVNDDRVYYSFRDHTLGLVFLRNSRELSEKGLYAELGEYEFHVFTDFCENREDEAGTWGQLCSALNGRGVGNLQDELKQLHYLELNAAFRAVLERGSTTATSSTAFTKGLAPAVRRFLIALAAQTGKTASKQKDILAEISVCKTFLNTLRTVKPSAKPAREVLARTINLLSTPSGSQLLVAWLLLKDRQIELTTYGLDYSLKQVGGHGTPAESEQSALLLQALLASKTVDTAIGATPLDRAFATVAGRKFMQVHESGGAEWFNKERYEELLEWFSILTLMEGAAGKPADRTIAAWLGRSAAENRRLSELAAHAGYRTKLLLRLLGPVITAPDTGANPGLTKKPAGKKSIAHVSTQRVTADVPDKKER